MGKEGKFLPHASALLSHHPPRPQTTHSGHRRMGSGKPQEALQLLPVPKTGTEPSVRF